jgi:hypothetical protein
VEVGAVFVIVPHGFARRTMRTLTLGTVVAALSAGPAAAQGAWCSQDMNATNCGYYTLQQCQAGVSGQGGYCYANPLVQPGTAEPRKQARPARKR